MSAEINQAKYRDPVLDMFYLKQLTFLKNEIETTTKTHYLRAVSAACTWYAISVNNRLFFNGNLLNREFVGSLILGHKSLARAWLSYNYITIEGMTVKQTAEIFQITDEKLVVTLANDLLDLQRKYTTMQEKYESLLEKHIVRENELEKRLTFLENKTPNLPTDFQEYNPTGTEQERLEYWTNLKTFFGDTPVTWENLKFSGKIRHHDFTTLRAFYNSKHKQPPTKKAKLHQQEN
jgi:hypothetical protein